MKYNNWNTRRADLDSKVKSLYELSNSHLLKLLDEVRSLDENDEHIIALERHVDSLQARIDAAIYDKGVVDTLRNSPAFRNTL